VGKEKVRTTLYLDKQLKKLADMQAVQEDTTLQEIFNKALRAELQKRMPSKKKKIDFITHKLNIPDNLTRKDYYDE